MGADDRHRRHARGRRLRGAGAGAVAPQADARLAAVRRARRRHRRRCPPAEQRAVVGGVRRRRADRGRDRPSRRRGPSARSIAWPVGRARPGRPQGGRRRTRRAGDDDPAHRRRDPPALGRPGGLAARPEAWSSRAAAGRPTCCNKAQSRPDRAGRPARRASRASSAAIRPRRWPGWGSSTPSSSAAASRSTWASARRRRCWPTSPARQANGPALVIAPPAVVGNWAAEAARFTPQLRVVVHHGAVPSVRGGARGRGGRRPTSSSPPTAPRSATSRRSPSAPGTDSCSTRRRPSRTQPTRPPSSCAASRPAPGSRSPARRSRTGSATSGPSSTSPTPAWSAPDRRSSPSSRARARPPCGRSTGSSCSGAPRAEPVVAAELPDRIDELDHCTMTPEQIGLYQAVLDELVADTTEVGRRAEAGRHPRRHHRAQADLQPPRRLPGRRPAARRTLGQAGPARGDRRVGVRGRRADPRLHPLRRVGQAAGRPPHRGHRRADRLLPRRPRPWRTRPPDHRRSRRARGRAPSCCR